MQDFRQPTTSTSQEHAKVKKEEEALKEATEKVEEEKVGDSGTKRRKIEKNRLTCKESTSKKELLLRETI